MGREEDVQWFNDIFDSGERPSLEQKARLSAQDQVPATDRERRIATQRTQDHIFELAKSGGYNRALQTWIHDEVTAVLPRIGVDLEENDRYIADYRKAMSKHVAEIEKAGVASNYR